MATKQIDEYYESLAYWKQQALDHEQELRDIKCNTIMNMAAEVEQLKAQNEKLRTKLADWQNGAELNELYIRQYEEIQQLKSKLVVIRHHVVGLKPTSEILAEIDEVLK